MRMLVMLALLPIVVACQDAPALDPGTVKFLEPQSMEESTVDITPFLNVPQDFVAVSPIPMPQIGGSIDSICPFGVKCDPTPTPAAGSIPTPSPVQDAPKLPIPEPSNQTFEASAPACMDDKADDDLYPPAVTVATVPSRMSLLSHKLTVTSDTPSAPGPDGLVLSPRGPGSEFTSSVAVQKAKEVQEAIDIAKEMAVALTPSFSPRPSALVVEEQGIDTSQRESAGLNFDYGSQVVFKPALPVIPLKPQSPPEPVILPSSTPSHSLSPSPSPSWIPVYGPTHETEWDDPNCVQPLPADAAEDGDMPIGDSGVQKLRGQQLGPKRKSAPVPGGTLIAELDAYDLVPPSAEETVPRSLVANDPAMFADSLDRTMADTDKYQVFALQSKDYKPQPFLRNSLRRVNLAGGGMGRYAPTIADLDTITKSAQGKAGDIIGQKGSNPFVDSFLPDEFASKELATDSAWATMNNKLTGMYYPSASSTPSRSPTPSHKPPSSTPSATPSASTPPKPSVFPRLKIITSAYPSLSPMPSTSPAPREEEAEYDYAPTVDGSAYATSGGPPGTPAANAYRSSGMDAEAVSVSAGQMVDLPGCTDVVRDIDGLADSRPLEVPARNRVLYLGDSTQAVRKRGILIPTGASAMPLVLGVRGFEGVANDQLAPSVTEIEGGSSETTDIAEASCQSRSSCGSCTSDGRCVWCPLLNACAEGDASGPFSMISCAGNFVYGTCPSALLIALNGSP